MTKSKVPDYALDALERMLHYVEESTDLLRLSMQGLAVLQARPTVVKALQAYYQDDRKFELQEAEKCAELACKEVQNGFPLFHAHTLVGLWGALEAAVEDCVVAILSNETERLSDPAFTRVRISIAEFEILEREERIRLIIEDVYRTQTTRLGVDLFEGLLSKLKFSGVVPHETKKLIWEMHNVRNVVVHRASVADRRLVTNCPWLGLKVGDKVVITHQKLFDYVNALCEYLTILIHRVGGSYSTVSDGDNESRHKTDEASQLTSQSQNVSLERKGSA